MRPHTAVIRIYDQSGNVIGTEIRSGSPSDAEAIARLVASFQSELTDDPSGAGAEAYWASVSVEAERE